MNKISVNIAKATLLLFISTMMASCARDLSSSTYTSDSTYNIAVEGVVLSTRKVTIKESERLSDNGAGMLAGGVVGGLAGSRVNNGNGLVIAGGAIIGSVAGAAIQNALGTSAGIEYIVKVDKSKLSDDYYEGSRLMRNAIAAVRTTGLVTIVQNPEKNMPNIQAGQNVIVIISENRSRIIPNNI